MDIQARLWFTHCLLDGTQPKILKKMYSVLYCTSTVMALTKCLKCSFKIEKTNCIFESTCNSALT